MGIKTERFCINAHQEYWFEAVDLPNLKHGEVLLAVRYMGICGSDMEYFKTGKCNIFTIQDYLTLIHEASAEVVQVAPDVHCVDIGDKVAVNPMRVCGTCPQCKAGLSRFCTHLFFASSAKIYPHMQGFNQRHIIVKQQQCSIFPHTTPYDMIALTEPLSVCLHAISKVDLTQLQTAVIFGAGSIGQLLAFSLKSKGVKTIYICDINEFSLHQAKKTGVSATFNLSCPEQKKAFEQLATDTPMTIGFEASGSTQALIDIINSVSVGATVVQLGILHHDMPRNTALSIINKEIVYIGCMRFDTEFADAVSLLHATKYAQIQHIITHKYDFLDTQTAFESAINPHIPTTKVMIQNHM